MPEQRRRDLFVTRIHARCAWSLVAGGCRQAAEREPLDSIRHEWSGLGVSDMAGKVRKGSGRAERERAEINRGDSDERHGR